MIGFAGKYRKQIIHSQTTGESRKVVTIDMMPKHVTHVQEDVEDIKEEHDEEPVKEEAVVEPVKEEPPAPVKEEAVVEPVKEEAAAEPVKEEPPAPVKEEAVETESQEKLNETSNDESTPKETD